MKTYLFFISVLIFSVSIAVGQSTTFTYQGKLTDAGLAANADYDFEFRIFDQPADGLQAGNTIQRQNVAVTGGVFTVQLDFGDVYPNAPRYIEISVRPSGGGTFTKLAPRQILTSVPYAVASLRAGNADFAVNSNQLGGIDYANYILNGDSRLTDDRNPTAGSPNYIQNSTSLQASSNFNVSGNGSVGGTLIGNIVGATTQINLGGNRAMTGSFGSANMSVGILSGAAGNGTSNSFFGVVAGNANSTGHDNSFFGSAAGNANSTGFQNSFFGAASGQSNSVGVDNSFFGFNSGKANTNGNNNTFVGSKAGIVNGTGSLNSFFGSNAGQANVSGGNNSFFGYHAGFNNTSNNNSFFGSNAGVNNSTGFNNSVFGKDAGFNLGGTNGNSFFGYTSGFNNNTGNQNSFFGAGSGGDNNSGARNSFVGYDSGYGNTSGFNNVFVGFEAGGGNTTGLKNTMIGANADLFTSNLSNATAIGADAVVGQSNSLVLGSIKGLNNASTDTKVGIGTATPSERLTIRTDSNSYGWIQTQDDIVFGSWIGGTGAAPYGGWIGTKTNHPLSFFVNSGSAAMTIEKSGFVSLNNVDIGGSGPSLCLNASNHISFCSSSLRYKTNIAAFNPGLTMLKQLRPITFDWKDGGGHDVGFGAEEVAKVSDLLVIKNNQGEVEGVKYDRISTVLVNAVKEQQTQIEQQAKLISSLENRLLQLERSVRPAKKGTRRANNARN